METPLSTRRVTRSQYRSALVLSEQGGEEADKNMSKSRPATAKKDRSALIDITNDSPIVGLAGKSVVSESRTPLSSVSKHRSNLPKSTPGSGEALLRGQVKTLLQKVEEEAEISRFLGSITQAPKPHFLGRFINSPMGIVAPTPANTPQVLGSGEEIIIDDFASEFPIEDHLNISQVVSDLFDVKLEESGVESDKSMITRSLLLDFSEKSDVSSEEKSPLSECSSVVTYESRKEASSVVTGEEVEEEDEEEEDASIWSIQVNASTHDEDEVEDIGIECKEEENYDDADDDDDDEGLLDDELMNELCEGMSKMNVVEFNGKHTRFVYNSEGEIEREEEVVHLKGLPTATGKHLRFAEDEEDI